MSIYGTLSTMETNPPPVFLLGKQYEQREALLSDSVQAGFRRISGAQWGKPVWVTVEGAKLQMHAGECLVSALAVSGHLALRNTTTGKRGMFCLMGVCQECVVVVDGVRRPACMTSVREGMDVRFVDAGN